MELRNSSLLSLNDTIGPAWLSYHWPAPADPLSAFDCKVTVTTELPVDVYIGLGASSDPNSYSYDMVFKNVTQ